MKYLLLFFFAIFLAFHPTHAQEYSKKWGKISQKEVDLKVYEKDPDAKAVVLYDIGESVFIDTEHGYDIQFTRTKRIKILNNSAIEQAEIKLPYYVDGYGKTEIYREIEAISYNIENGKLVKTPLDEAHIYEEIINENWRSKNFVVPNVKEGTIIEYKSVLETPFHFNLPDWIFQDVIPTIHSKYIVKMIPFYEYVFIVQGTNHFDYQNSEVEESFARRYAGIEFQNYVHTYVLENIPAFKDEAYMTSIKDYLIKMDFQLAKINRPTGASTDIISTWEELNRSLNKHFNFGKYIKKSTKFAEKILDEELDLANLDDENKAKKIIDYVKKAYSWSGYNAKYASKTPKELSNQKTGNAADINLFLIALLQTARIDVEPVILSTRGHGKIDMKYPFSHFFNYVIPMVKIDGHIFFTDGTNPFLAYNRIPPRCINEKGLIVNDQEIKWANLSTNIKSVDNRSIELNIDANTLLAHAKVTNHSTEFEALNYKKKYNDDTSKIKNQLLENGFEKVSKIRTLNFKTSHTPYIVAYEGKTKIESIDSKLIISPFLNFPIKENRLTQKNRSFPVDFTYPNSETFKSIIYIPENYQVADLPPRFEMKNGLADIMLTYSIKENIVTVEGEYYFKKSIYQPNEYARIKSYLNAIVQKFNAQLVLVKSGEI